MFLSKVVVTKQQQRIATCTNLMKYSRWTIMSDKMMWPFIALLLGDMAFGMVNIHMNCSDWCFVMVMVIGVLIRMLYQIVDYISLNIVQFAKRSNRYTLFNIFKHIIQFCKCTHILIRISPCLTETCIICSGIIFHRCSSDICSGILFHRCSLDDWWSLLINYILFTFSTLHLYAY